MPPVSSFAFSVPGRRGETLPVMEMTSSARSAWLCLRDLWKFLGAEYHLRPAFAVSQIDENHAAVVTTGIDPPGERDGLAGVFRAEAVAGGGAVHKGRGEYERRGALPVRIGAYRNRYTIHSTATLFRCRKRSS